MKAAAKYYTVRIRTKIYIKKYLVEKYGDPVVLNFGTLLGASIILGLSKRIYNDMHELDRDIRYRSFTCTIDCKLAATQVDSCRIGLSLTKSHVIAINRYFELEFEEYFFHYCNFKQTE